MPTTADDAVTLFMCGDVMTGRGIDQILPNSGDPTLHESAESGRPRRMEAGAIRYVELAEQHSGPIPRDAAFDYVWGNALKELEQVAPDIRIINLETAVTTSDEYWKEKAIHYRMSPRNIPCLTAARIDCCVLANNHVLDWGYAGLEETLTVLKNAGIETVGAGRHVDEAQQPAVFELPNLGRVLVFAVGSPSSGIPPQWAATKDRPGVHLIDEHSPGAAKQIEECINRFSRADDLIVVSIHWGPNWGYEISREQQAFAHDLVENAGVDIIHGHSSHHVKGIEIHRKRPILYGCGDLLTDYEGIEGYERFRDDLGLMYFVHVNSHTGNLDHLDMTPTRLRRLKVEHASPDDVEWLIRVYNRRNRHLGTRLEPADTNRLTLHRR